MARNTFIFVFVFTYFLFLQGSVGQSNTPDNVLTVDCIRCICHARTGCYRMRNCASYSIAKDYWTRGGSETIADDNPSDPDAYIRCMLHEGCIINTIRGYIRSYISTERDCNCDGEVTCKDFAAIHLKADNCRSGIDTAMLTRFDRCATEKNVPNTAGWQQYCRLPNAV